MGRARRRGSKETEPGRLKLAPPAPASRWDRGLPILLLAIALSAWEVLARAGMIPTLLFPAPSAIARALLQGITEGELAAHLGASLLRVGLGFACGCLPALILGLLMGWSRKWRAVLDPVIAACHPVPKIAILPLIMVIFGIGEVSKVLAIAAGSFFPMLISTLAGVRQIHPVYFEVAQNYGATVRKVFTRVVLPGSLPMVFAGLRLALNVALLLTIAVELVAANKGLGAMIWFAWETLRTEDLYASLAVISLLGIGANAVLQRLSLRLVPWQAERPL